MNKGAILFGFAVGLFIKEIDTLLMATYHKLSAKAVVVQAEVFQKQFVADAKRDLSKPMIDPDLMKGDDE